MIKNNTDPEVQMNNRNIEEQQTIDLERQMKNRTSGEPGDALE